jgi:DNA-binding GntR family transcriptional regulator
MRKTEVLLPESLFADIKRESPVPLYFQVSKKFEAAIRSGTLPPGSRIENEISLSERLGLSRPTIRRAIQSLVDAGLVVRRRGVGSQVVHGSVTRGLELTSLFDDLKSGGGKPKTQVIRHEIEPATPAIAAELGVTAGSPVLFI